MKTEYTTREISLLVMALLAMLWPTVAMGEGTVIPGAEVIGDPVAPHKFFGDLRDLPRATLWEDGDAVIYNPRRSTKPAADAFTPAKPDPLLARQAAATPRGPMTTEVVHAFEGIDNGNSQPPDPTGDIGRNYFIQSVNASSFAIYDKVTGALVAGPTAMDSLGSGNCASGAGDPIIVYDQLADRWVLTEFTFANNLCVYVSMTDDPVSGGWCAYEFTAPGFPDYPKYAVWPDAYTVSTNESGGTVYALDRENMITCGIARPFQRLVAPALPGLGFQAFTPADVDGATPPPAGAPNYMMRHRDTELGNQGPNLPTQDVLEIWAFDVDWTTPANTTITQLPDILVSEFDSNLCPPISVFSCIPQPATTVKIDPLLEIIMYRLTYRNFGTHEAIVGVLQTDIGDFEDHSGERWFELRKTGAGDWALHQEGTFSPDADHRFMAAIAMDGGGNILLGYVVSSSSTSPSLRFTGRLASDPAGVMTVVEQTLIAGSGNNSSSIRFGDYSQMGIDPEDDCTFWFTAEYTEGSNSNTTGIGAIRFPICGSGSLIFADDFESGDTSVWMTSFIFLDGFESGNTSAWSSTVGSR